MYSVKKIVYTIWLDNDNVVKLNTDRDIIHIQSEMLCFSWN